MSPSDIAPKFSLNPDASPAALRRLLVAGGFARCRQEVQ